MVGRRVISVIIALLLMLSITATARERIRIINGDCNVRTGPGLDYDTLGTLSEDSVVNWTGDSESDDRGVKWYRVEYDGEYGWVSSRYATITDRTSGSAGTVSNEIQEGTVYGSSGSSNIRTGPGLAYEVIGALSEGDSLRYAGSTVADDRGVNWYKVDTGSGTGWVSSRYTTLYLGGDTYEFDESIDYADDGSEEHDILYDRMHGAVYSIGLRELRDSLDFSYGMTGSVVQTGADLEDENISYVDVPHGNYGCILADLDSDDEEELLVVGETVDRMLTLSVFESTDSGSILSAKCTVNISVLPYFGCSDAQGMDLGVFLYDGTHIGIGYTNSESLRGDGVTITFISVVYSGNTIACEAYGTYSGSDFPEESSEVAVALSECGVDADIQAVFGGQQRFEDLFPVKTMIAQITSENLLDYEEIGIGKAICTVMVADLSNAQALLVFTFK